MIDSAETLLIIRERSFEESPLPSSQLRSCFSLFRVPSYHILPVVKCLLAMVGIPPALPLKIWAQLADRIFAVNTGFSVGTLGPLTPTRIAGRDFRPTENQNTRHDCPWLRMRVLRRDHYRCRACEKKGDEITLRVYPIRPLGSHVETMVTLCASCQSLLETLRLNERLNGIFIFCRGKKTKYYAQIYSDNPNKCPAMQPARSINGAGATARLSVAGAPAGAITVPCGVSDDKGRTVSATTSVRIEAPPPPRVPKTQTLWSIHFGRDPKGPTRANDEAKACIDDVSLSAQRQADATLVLVDNGTADKPHHAKSRNLAARDPIDTKDCLVKERGTDSARIQAREGGPDSKEVDLLVPAGATFNNDISGASVVDESSLQPEVRR
jgi:hypothetical protein